MSADDDLPQVNGCPASSSCPPLPAIAVIGVIFCHERVPEGGLS